MKLKRMRTQVNNPLDYRNNLEMTNIQPKN